MCCSESGCAPPCSRTWPGSFHKVVARTPVGVRATGVVWGLGPAGADGGVGGRHVVAGGLHLLAGLVGLLVDDLEVAAQLGDELLAGHRTRATPEVAGGQHIAHDGLVLLLQGRGLGADHRAVGIHVAELVADRHCFPPTSFGCWASWTGCAGRPALAARSCWHPGSARRAPRAAC